MSEPRVLLVEDCEIHQALLKGLLKEYDLTVVNTAQRGSECISSLKYDLIILDMLLEDGDGSMLCQSARGSALNESTPIIFLTSRSEMDDRLRGFDLGADDYVSKPFNHLELKARIAALIRRNTKKSKEAILSYGPIDLDQNTLTAWITAGDERVPMDLTNSEFKLLVYFLHHPDTMVTRDQILKNVWSFGQTHVTDRTVDAKISLLRKKLHPHGKMLRSIYGSGYKFSLDALKEKTKIPKLKKSA